MGLGNSTFVEQADWREIHVKGGVVAVTLKARNSGRVSVLRSRRRITSLGNLREICLLLRPLPTLWRAICFTSSLLMINVHHIEIIFVAEIRPSEELVTIVGK